MSERSLIRRRPSAAMVVATIALVAAVSGTAVAATQINGADIRNKSIPGWKLQNQAVGTAQINDFGVQARDLQNGAVTISKLRAGAVTSTKLAAGAVTTAKLAKNSVNTSRIAPGAVMGSDVATGTITRTNLSPAARVPLTVVRQSAIVGVVNGSNAEATVACGPGETLISGGGGITSTPAPGFIIVSSRPQPVGAAATSWQVIATNVTGSTQTFSAYAICASAA